MPPPVKCHLIEPRSEGVLLYYQYAELQDVSLIVKWYEDLCLRLRLVGRIRVAQEGVNVTIGGCFSALEEHIEAVRNHPSLGSCDFKVARCREPLLANPVLVHECGFDALSVRAVKELVSLGNGASHVSPHEAGVHLSPADFHQHLLGAAANSKWTGGKGGVHSNGIVVLDARNVYETRIGRFQQLPGVEFCNPGIRQFSELPAWLDANEDHLRDKHIYMYCTGGVRCERASAYLRVKGPGFQNVYQLSGGIQRYLEAFPEGGLFAGKNFVFDPRVAVGSLDECKIGECLLCHSPFDDYTPRCRCSQCRLLVLVCDACREEEGLKGYVCELCQKGVFETKTGPERGESECSKGMVGFELESLSEVGSSTGGGDLSDLGESPGQVLEPGKTVAQSETRKGVAEPGEEVLDSLVPELSGRVLGEQEALPSSLAPRRRLRILCLHGFRQTGRGLKGRLAAFQSHLKDLVELVFVDGPFQLPCVYYPRKWTADGEVEVGKEQRGLEPEERGVDNPRGKERGTGSVGGGNRNEGNDGRECAGPESIVGRKIEGGSQGGQLSHSRVAGCTGDTADTGGMGTRRGAAGDWEVRDPPARTPNPKFAWLVSPEQLQEIVRPASGGGMKGAALGSGPVGVFTGGKLSADSRDGSGGEEMDPEGENVVQQERDRSNGLVADWKPAIAQFGPLQYQTQTAGWNTSLAHLRRIFAEQGPFDGVLGFSQGAAIAAALCHHRTAEDGSGEGDPIAFKFVVLCSGFKGAAEDLTNGSAGVIDLPSLHVFGSVKGKDRQIQVAESERLIERFEPTCRVVIRHSAGHIVPSAKGYINQYRPFFMKFQ